MPGTYPLVGNCANGTSPSGEEFDSRGFWLSSTAHFPRTFSRCLFNDPREFKDRFDCIGTYRSWISPEWARPEINTTLGRSTVFFVGDSMSHQHWRSFLCRAVEEEPAALAAWDPHAAWHCISDSPLPPPPGQHLIPCIVGSSNAVSSSRYNGFL